jgi:thiamine biosynthesis lipoprotein
MACRFEVLLPGETPDHIAAALAALDEADRLEAALTVFRDTSQLVHVNRCAADGPVAVDRALFDLLALCRELHAETDGAFDITSTPLSRCWGFLRREGRVPSRAEIDAARAPVGMDAVALDADRRTVRFGRPGAELNLGSIGKGHAIDRMGAGLRRAGVRAALLSAGGSSVLAIGPTPRSALRRGSPKPEGEGGGAGAGWMIDVRSRRVKRDRLARLYLRDAALATSGAGEQYVDVDGVRYGHVLDPRTGWPASGVLSASVVCRRAAIADALSTAFLVGGVDLAERYCASHPGTFAMLVPDDDSEMPRSFGTHPGVIVEAA